jgi:peptidoglycan/LPS O-acetylase OafA/YrhL
MTTTTAALGAAPLPSAGAPLPALTGARFVAAFVVVLYHLARFDDGTIPAAVDRVVSLGPVAVTFFFVLSGFVLSWSCVDDDGRVPSRVRFYAARVARLLPVHALSLVIVFPIVVGLWRRAHDAGLAGSFAVDVVGTGALVVACVQAWWPQTALAWNPPAWSLACEVFFYLVFPLVAGWLLGRGSPHAARVAAVAWGLSLAAGATLLAVRGADVDVDRDVHNAVVDGWRYHPLVRLPDFLVGAAAAVALRRGDIASAVLDRLTRGALLAFALVVVLVAVGALPPVLSHNGLLAPAFAILIVRLATAPSTTTRVLSSPALLLLGEASYALYLLHVPAFYWITAVGMRRGVEHPLDRPVVAIGAAALAVVVAVVVHVAFERPARRALRRAFGLPAR